MILKEKANNYRVSGKKKKWTRDPQRSESIRQKVTSTAARKHLDYCCLPIQQNTAKSNNLNKKEL